MGTEVALMAIVATSAAVSSGAAMANSDKGMNLPNPGAPPDAANAEAQAQAAGVAAKRKQLLAVGDATGQGSTILTGGQLGLTGMQTGGKTLLGG